MRTLRIVSALIGVLVAAGCMTPPSSAQKLTDAARELNTAARFGRIDLALERTADGTRDHFVERRREWGGDVRVVDFELSGLDMKATDDATVVVDVAWVRMDEGVLKSTRVEQRWKVGEERGGWRLVGEKRLAGDFGLFGEKVTVLRPESHGDVHFPSRTIR